MTTDPKSYNSAAEYNSQHLNGALYSSFSLKHEYYQWAQAKMEKKGIKTKWFAMNAKIVGPFEVGLTAWDPGFVLSSGTQKFLNNIGAMVIKENMSVYNKLSSSGNFNGKTGGMSLDRELLYNEQTKIQDLMNSMKPDELTPALKDYNDGFKIFQYTKSSGHYLNIASSIIGGDIQFGNLQHRLIIGQVLMYQMNGTKIDDAAKKQILTDTASDAVRYNEDKNEKK